MVSVERITLLSMTSGPALILVTLYAMSYPASDSLGVDGLNLYEGLKV